MLIVRFSDDPLLRQENLLQPTGQGTKQTTEAATGGVL